MLRFTEPIDYADVPPGTAINGPLAATLFILRRSGRCSAFTKARAGYCFSQGKEADAVYGTNQACTVCIADKALKDGGFLIEVPASPLPPRPGRP